LLSDEVRRPSVAARSLTFARFPIDVSARRRKLGSAVLVLLWAASISLVTVVAVIALYAMSFEVIN
jgi:hypothetical protein